MQVKSGHPSLKIHSPLRYVGVGVTRRGRRRKCGCWKRPTPAKTSLLFRVFLDARPLLTSWPPRGLIDSHGNTRATRASRSRSRFGVMAEGFSPRCMLWFDTDNLVWSDLVASGMNRSARDSFTLDPAPLVPRSSALFSFFSYVLIYCLWFVCFIGLWVNCLLGLIHSLRCSMWWSLNRRVSIW